MSVAWGCAIQAALFALSVMLGRGAVANLLVWNLRLAVALAGPLAFLGYDASGREYHAGTGAHLLAGILGLVVGIALYAVVAWWTMGWWKGRRSRSEIA